MLSLHGLRIFLTFKKGYLFFYLTSRVTVRNKMLSMSHLNQTKARKQELHAGLPHVWQRLKFLSPYLMPPRGYINCKQDQKWSWYSNRGTPIWKVGSPYSSLNSVPQYLPRNFFVRDWLKTSLRKKLTVEERASYWWISVVFGFVWTTGKSLEAWEPRASHGHCLQISILSRC